MKKILVFVLFAVAVMQSSVYAENKAESFTLSPFIGGYTYEVDGDPWLDTSLIYGIRGGYNFTSNFGVEAVFHYASADRANGFGSGAGDVDVFNGRLDALFHFIPAQRFVPFVAAGYGGIRNEFPTDTGIVRKTLGAFNYGVGAKLYLTENVALRADVRHLIMHEDWTMHNVEYTAGLSFAFGGEKPAPPPVAEPAPKPVVLDTDGDGVLDPKDKCPDTPVGVKVDRDGCPVDADGDGVADYQDNCPGTPQGDKVDLNGCTIVSDADRDGVVDAMDKCPGTPQSVKVDSNGCPVDTDGDGVADYLDKCPGTPQGDKVDLNGCTIISDADSDGVVDAMDKCPGTPQGVKVDSNGCPVDSDGDGVADYLDKCPGTPQGATVDQNGCQCITLKVEFDTNKTVIKPSFHNELKIVGDFLNKNPTANGVIDGHTDSVGSDAYNLKLSNKRAANVRKYIVDKFGIAPGRLSAKGHGESKPIADNGTAEGRQQNRRITATFDCVIAN